MNEKEVAESLTDFLVKPRNNNWNSKSPLQDYVEAEITNMARAIAGEVVQSHPELVNAIRERTVNAIRQAMREDGYLSRKVTEAVAKQLTNLSLERELECENKDKE